MQHPHLLRAGRGAARDVPASASAKVVQLCVPAVQVLVSHWPLSQIFHEDSTRWAVLGEQGAHPGVCNPACSLLSVQQFPKVFLRNPPHGDPLAVSPWGSPLWGCLLAAVGLGSHLTCINYRATAPSLWQNKLGSSWPKSPRSPCCSHALPCARCCPKVSSACVEGFPWPRTPGNGCAQLAAQLVLVQGHVQGSWRERRAPSPMGDPSSSRASRLPPRGRPRAAGSRWHRRAVLFEA